MTLALAGCDADKPKQDAPKHSEADVKARADEVYAAFGHWHDNLPDTAAAAKTCDEAAIAGFGTEKNQITFLAYQGLRRTAGQPWDGNNSMVRFMTHAYLRYPPQAELDLGKESTVKQLMRLWNFVEYVGVVVPIEERKAKAVGAHAGTGGALTGQLVVYRKGEAQPLCHTPFSVTSSGATSYRAALGASSSQKESKATHALKKQTCRDISKVLGERIGELSKTLKPSFIDCNAV